MARLLFPFNVADFYPLQPEEAELEEWRRNQPQYASYYHNRSVELLEQGNATHVPETLTYAQWQEVCRARKANIDQARAAYKQAIAARDKLVAELNLECEKLRAALRELEATPIPPQPRSARRGNA